MGMYDYIDVPVELLPISKEEKKRLNNHKNWQTKNLICCLKRYAIIYNELIGPDGNKVDLHQYLYFYDYIDGEWYEFDAKFTDGKLLEITRVK